MGVPLSLASAILVLVSSAIWYPEIDRYWIETPQFGIAMQEVHRHRPSNAVLEAIADQSMMSDNPITGPHTIPLAERFLAGRLEYPFFDPITVTPQFRPADLLRGTDTIQLLTASLIGPDWLLRAYEITGREPMFEMARRHIEAFAAFERGRWVPYGTVWSGHAAANRAQVLARFWRHYRARADYEPDLANAVMEHAARIGELLSKPAVYVARSNHGVMHNIGLLQVATAFPMLPRAVDYRRIAIERLSEQMRFYVHEEGVVLEHSAGYHFSGIRLLGYLRELYALSGEPFPVDWQLRHDRAIAFFRALQRPDGTLPMFGNTLSMTWRLPAKPLAGAAEPPPFGYDLAPTSVLHPVSGYSIWWDAAALSAGAPKARVQTTVPWSNFPGHAHKLADEMSMLLWAGGASWLTNVGYAPYHGPHSAQAAAWDGSSAPHLVGESATAPRDTSLRAQLDVPGLRVLDLERMTPDGPSVRRQIVQSNGRWWIVLDTAHDPRERLLSTQWTLYPGTRVTSFGDATTAASRFYALTRSDSSVRLLASLQGGGQPTIGQFRGSTAPYGGWAIVDRRPVATESYRVMVPARTWLLSVFTLDAADDPRSPRSPLADARIRAPDAWEIALDIDDDEVHVHREGERISIRSRASPAEDHPLDPGPDVTAARAAVRDQFAAVQAKYPRQRNLIDYRWRATYAGAVAWTVAIGILVVPQVRRMRWVRRGILLGFGAFGGWLALGYL